MTASRNAQPLPIDADPWLWWQQLRSDLLAGSTIKGHQSPERIAVLAERRGDQWPLELELCEYYRDSRIGTGTVANCRDTITRVRQQLARMKTSRPVKEQLFDALPAINAGDATGPRPEQLSGKGVVVGFVDNGCAFAHPNFVKADGTRSRVERLWDQSSSPGVPTGGGDWYSPPEFCYGREIDLAGLDLRTGTRFPPAPGQSGLNPNRLYEKLGYELTEIIAGESIPAVVTHGTHVMDIAAGSGSISGMAPAADLIFVQLPQSAILENTDQASARHLLDGVAYVFRHAGDRAAVVNISYNAYTGPHDGTSLLECGLDELLQQPGRAVVISAANARNKKCHARGAIPRDNRRALTWEVHADDDTENFIEIWYPGTTRLEVRVRPEGAKDWSASIGPGQYCNLTTGDLPFGAVIQRSGDPGNGDNQILIAINPTLKHRIDKTAAAALWTEAPSGAWVVELCNTGPNDVVFHAWIERDDRGRDPVAEQSCFAETDAVEEGTVGGLCTGRSPIVVGAYNSTAGALEPYSSAGPTVDGRQKPDLCAPGASDPSGFGILAAAALSANPVRLNGTSMSAPFVTGLIALMFEMMGKHRLDIETIRQILVRTASPLGGADATASGAGRVNAAAALTFLKQRLNLP